MKHAVRRSLAPSLLAAGWAATLVFALAGCSPATSNSVDAIVADAAVLPDAAAVTLRDASDGPATPPDARATDATTAFQADAGDATSVRADAVGPDTARTSADALVPDSTRLSADADALEADPVASKDAAPESVSVRADAAASDGARSRADATAIRDTSFRADGVARDTLVEDPDAESLPCQVTGPVTLVHLTPLELKTILDSSEDPYLINVKGTSIANIPGTDAVLANDIPGIEKLVGGDLCADIILYCGTGHTSQTVGDALIAKGYLRVRDLEGGIAAWTAAGYPTE